VLLSDGQGGLRSTVAYPTSSYSRAVAIADLDGDGKLDLAVANEDSSTVSVLLGNGDGTFRPRFDYPTAGRGASSIAIADLLGTGHPVIATANYLGSTATALLDPCLP
jgi:hypothetical protein